MSENGKRTKGSSDAETYARWRKEDPDFFERALRNAALFNRLRRSNRLVSKAEPDPDPEFDSELEYAPAESSSAPEDEPDKLKP